MRNAQFLETVWGPISIDIFRGIVFFLPLPDCVRLSMTESKTYKTLAPVFAGNQCIAPKADLLASETGDTLAIAHMLGKYWNAFNFLRFQRGLSLVATREDAETLCLYTKNDAGVQHYFPVLIGGLAKAEKLNIDINTLKCVIAYTYDLNRISLRAHNAPLHFAMISNNIKVAELLLAAKAATNLQNVDGQTPLHLAADKGNPALVNMLLMADQGKADYREIKDNNGLTPLELATLRGRNSCVKALREFKFVPTPSQGQVR